MIAIEREVLAWRTMHPPTDWILLHPPIQQRLCNIRIGSNLRLREKVPAHLLFPPLLLLNGRQVQKR